MYKINHRWDSVLYHWIGKITKSVSKAELLYIAFESLIGTVIWKAILHYLEYLTIYTAYDIFFVYVLEKL